MGTLVGEVSFPIDNDSNQKRVKFFAVVYLDNRDRVGILRPPTYTYDIVLESEKINYQKRVQISHELQASEADRFTIKLATDKSSCHRFQVTVRGHYQADFFIFADPNELFCASVT